MEKKNNILKTNNVQSISFSGGGYNCVYHLGIVKYIFENPDKFKNCKYLGASGGAGIGAYILINESNNNKFNILNDTLDQIIQINCSDLNLTDQVTKYSQIMNNIINEHNYYSYIYNNNRCYISITELLFNIIPKNKIINNFFSYEDFMDHITASGSVPYIQDNKFRTVRDNYCIDGGLTNNQPIIDNNTVTISCLNLPLFKADIYPKIISKIQYTIKPPNEQYLKNLFNLGYNNAIEYFTKKDSGQWIELKNM